ncbi:MAG: ABC-F family ATP-binding cassette domain-containing protein [Bacteroidota bacterium]|nr:ABC-F family ATP-binding cassette domain-containing protein [Bacteroidota bacterium]
MNYLSVENLSKYYAGILLFDKISFGIEKGQKISLIAKNGTGKSTLFRLISRIEEADSGKITFNNEVKLGFLQQQPYFDENKTVLEAVFDSDNEILRAVQEYELAMQNPENKKRLESALEKMDVFNAWDYENEIKQILSKLNIYKLNQKIGELSGGEKKRVALAKVLIEKPDFYLLDEPTNHLDLEMIEWLEEHLKSRNLTLFMVTHDRYFLERVCDKIIELDEGKLFHYEGNYSYYLTKKTERKDKQVLDVSKAKNLLRKELDWMRRMPKARGTKSKERIDRFYKLEEKSEKKVFDKKIDLDVLTKRLGKKIVEFHNVSKSFDDNVVLKNFSYKFAKKERVGIAGPNGSGKTTFLNLLTGKLKADSGEVIKGETVVYGYYKQELMRVSGKKRVVDVVKENAEYIPLSDGTMLSASQMLERFLFPPKMHYIPVEKLSGGEKRRLYLLTVLMKNPNFLIFDEPTNDLDILTLNVLENFIENFKGCLVVVTHDRYFMDKLVDHIFIFKENGEIKDFNGKYTEYKLSQESAKTTIGIKKVKKKEKIITKKTNQKKGLSFKEKYELKQLGEEIDNLEERKKELENIINRGETDHKKLQDISKELSEIIEQLDDKGERWLELAELEG